MQQVPAQIGIGWVKEGIALFRKRPMEFSLLFLGYLFLIFVLVVLPVVGKFLFFLAAPALSIAFWHGCALAAQDKRISPALLFIAFRAKGVRSLMLLGVFYFIAAYLALAASQLVDGGEFWKIMHGEGEIDPKLMRESNLSLAIQFTGIFYTIILLPLWYAAPLIFWKNMGVIQAIFYSAVAVWRNLSAFLFYGLTWMMINIIVGSFVSLLAVLLFGQSLAFILMSVLSVILTTAMYCSFYPTYMHVFGNPYAAAEDTQ